MRKQRLKLIPEKEYLFTHKRKRTFRGVYKGIVRAPSTDTMDEFYYECEVDTALSANPWADFRKGATTRILLRPSLITLVQAVPRNFPLREYAAPLGRGKTVNINGEHWAKEYIQRLRSIFRNRKRA